MKKTMIVMTLAVVMFSSCKENKMELSGAGATFPQPYYNMIFREYSEKNNLNISYGGIGSGGGIRSLKDGVVDFAGSDAFLSDQEMSSMDEVVHIPSCLGAVVLAYNVEGNPDINLSGDIITDIYNGKITKWNDERITSINPGNHLPNKNITVVYRSDGSGTTYVLTDYLSKINDEWSKTIGTGKSVSFPTGIAGKGNPGVAGIIKNTINSIGYISSEYAFSQKLKVAAIQNVDGEFILPTTESITKAAMEDTPPDTRTMITNSHVSGSYPISCLTWIIVYKNQAYNKRSQEKSNATIDLLKYMLSDEAQSQAAKIHYAPLPENLRQDALNQINSIEYKQL